MHHTDCGMMAFTDEALRDKLRQEAGVAASHLQFLAFTDLDQSVRDDVDRLRGDAFLPPDATVSGHVYDVRTGELREVVPAG